MEYKKASEIRNKGLLSLIAENKFQKEKSLGKAIGGAISDKFKAKAVGIKEKFDPLNIVRGITGKGTFGRIATTIAGRALGKSEKDISYFGGYARKAKQRVTGTNISPIDYGQEQGQMTKGPIVNVLKEMYEFMQKTHEVDKKDFEIQQAFLEEKSADDEIKHKELVRVIKKYVKIPSKPEDTKEGGGMFDWIMNIVNNIKDSIMEIVDKAIGALKLLIAPLLSFLGMLGSSALSILGSLGAFLLTPLGIGFLTAVAAGTIVAWIADLIAQDPHAALRGEGPAGTAVAGPGAETQLPSYEKEQSNKVLVSKANEVDKKGIKNASLEELEAKQQLMIEYGAGGSRSRVNSGKGDESDKIKAKQLNDIETEISTRKSKKSASTTNNEIPESTPNTTASTSAPTSASVTPASTTVDTNTSASVSAPLPKITSIPEQTNPEDTESTPGQSVIAVNNSTKNIGGSNPKMFNLDTIKVRNDDINRYLFKSSVVV